jgi:hypothetical protein
MGLNPSRYINFPFSIVISEILSPIGAIFLTSSLIYLLTFIQDYRKDISELIQKIDR